MANCSVTIGIPVYNAENYIERCLISVLHQTFSDFEVLLVDDCGTDKSIEKALELSRTDSNGEKIRIIRHEHNKGVAEARNTILDEASGKYLFFMDSDDKLSEDAIEKLYLKAELTNAETVWGSFVNVEFESDNILPSVNGLGRYPDVELVGIDELAKYANQDIHEHLQQSIWNILYRVDFIRNNGLRFEQHGSFDDGIFQAEMQPLIRRAVLLSDITYYYYHRPNSLTHIVERKGFKIDEATNAIEAIDCHRNVCRLYSSKPYFDCRTTKVLKEAFYISIGILKHRDDMDGIVSDAQVKSIMTHPATFSQIVRFKKYRSINLLWYFLLLLPPSLFVKVLYVIAKLRKLA